MLTADQQQAAVVAVIRALSAYTTPEVAEERARNIVMALMFPVTPAELREIVVTMLSGYAIVSFTEAVHAVEAAFAIACLPDNGERFAALVRYFGATPEQASRYMQDNGWTVPEGTVMA